MLIVFKTKVHIAIIDYVFVAGFDYLLCLQCSK